MNTPYSPNAENTKSMGTLLAAIAKDISTKPAALAIDAMTTQEMFDTVVKHLWTQKAPSVDANGNCMYRGIGGFSCAAGCLIPDALYSCGLEGCLVSSTRMEGLFSNFTKNQLEILGELQNAHDKWARGVRTADRCNNLQEKKDLTESLWIQLNGIAADYNLIPYDYQLTRTSESSPV
jgi:hypothetical protein